MNQKVHCPSCRSTRICAGKIVNREKGTGLTLRREHRKLFYLVSHPVASFPPHGQVCLDCGLLWMQADADEMRDVLRKGERLLLAGRLSVA